MTITLTLSGNVGGRRFSYSSVSTVADVDAAMFAQATNGDSPDIFTPQSYTGLSASVFIGNSIGLNRYEVELASTDVVYFFLPAGLPVIMYNGDGFNGAFNYSTTPTDSPDEDPTRYAAGAVVGKANYRAIAALKAIS